MQISLKEINEDNWRECISIKVRKDQERFVASNENALALAYAHKEMEPRGVYADDVMVGFIMYAIDPDDGLFYINRFNIDEKHQGKGFGRKALTILLDQLRERGATTVDIIHKPDNHIAIKLYESLGFRLTEETLGDDVISRVNLI